MNIAIIYHDADFDGKLSNEVCRYHLKRQFPEANIHSYGWDYGRPAPEPTALGQIKFLPESGQGGSLGSRAGDWFDYHAIYIVDLSVDELMSRRDLRDTIVWIDHHKSAIEKWDKPAFGRPENDGGPDYALPRFNGIRIDGVAACRLCWQWFTWAKNQDGTMKEFVPPLLKSTFVDHEVQEPRLIRLAGEYDIWDHRDPDAKVLQFGLRALENWDFGNLVGNEFLGAVTGARTCSDELVRAISQGRAIKSYCDKQNYEYSKTFSRTLNWEGLSFCCLNIGQRGNSDLFLGGIQPHHDACFAWRDTGRYVTVSLYHIEGKTHIDLSLIATKYGGGGHKGACGFKLSLPELAKILMS